MSVWVCRLRGDKVTLQRVVWLDVFFFSLLLTAICWMLLNDSICIQPNAFFQVLKILCVDLYLKGIQIMHTYVCQPFFFFFLAVRETLDSFLNDQLHRANVM